MIANIEAPHEEFTIQAPVTVQPEADIAGFERPNFSRRIAGPKIKNNPAIAASPGTIKHANKTIQLNAKGMPAPQRADRTTAKPTAKFERLLDISQTA